MKQQSKHIFRATWLKFYMLVIFSVGAISNNVFSQCPPNIDFEKGDFSGWLCYKSTFRTHSPINWGPAVPANPSYHEILANWPGEGNDYYGGFPKNCPNGSGYSALLGKNIGGGEAAKMSYTFTIPANLDTFNLIYNYALVLQDPGHIPEAQPRFAVEVFNVTDNEMYDCSSFTFIINGGIPGFYLSDNTPGVWCKNWSSSSINLNGKAGKTFSVSFYVTGCAYDVHFGYAYVDINAECYGAVNGSVFCKNSSAVKLTAPFGYSSYTWYNSSFTQQLGTNRELTIDPAPASGSLIALELRPHFGYGCVDTLFVKLIDSLSVSAEAGTDKSSCFNDSLQIGSPPVSGINYRWSPATDIGNPDISYTKANPSVTTTYYLTASNEDGKCTATDSVTIIRPCTVSQIFVPGAFTPGNDGLNDKLRPFATGPDKVLSFTVYNRYGQVLFTANNDRDGWDGSFKGKLVGMQTVVWVVKAVKRNGKIYFEKGTTVLLQ